MHAQTEHGRAENRRRRERYERRKSGRMPDYKHRPEALQCLGAGMGIGIGIGTAGGGAGATPPPGSVGGPTDPLTIATGATPIFGFSADVGTAESGGAGTGLSTWTDQSGSAFTATQAALGNRPDIETNALNTHSSITFVKANTDWLTVGTLDLPAPGTTPTFICGVIRFVSLTSNDSFFGGGSTTLMRMLGASSTTVRCNDGTNGNTVTVATGSWYWFEAFYSNNASNDYLRIGTTQSASGVAFGNGNPAAGAFALGAHTSTGTNPPNIKMPCIFAFNALPTNLATPTTGIRAWAAGYYGGSLII